MHSRAIISRSSLLLLICAGLVVLPGASAGEEPSALEQKLTRIFADEEFEPETFGPAKWLDEGTYYTTLESSGALDEAKDIVRYETATGKREVLVEASRLVPAGETEALEIDDYAWSEDKKQLLIFTNTQRVWRQNTRGDYWVMDLASGEMVKLGGEAATCGRRTSMSKRSGAGRSLP
jgi:dipeptidyl-peptidase-4